MMAYIERKRSSDRWKAAIVVATLHALLGYAFVTGLALEVAQQASDRLKIFDVTEPPPPPPEEIPDPAVPKAPEQEGAAAPESMEAVVVPEPEVWLAIAPTIPTVPVAGTSDVPGTGSGSGGEGTGTGSGASGTGTGGGGTGAQRIRGAFDYEDLPRSARERFARGAVGVRFVVQPNGRVTGCAVTRSSGDSVLDETTCRLIERRFRYRPARNAAGQAVAETVRTVFEWIPTSG